MTITRTACQSCLQCCLYQYDLHFHLLACGCSVFSILPALPGSLCPGLGGKGLWAGVSYWQRHSLAKLQSGSSEQSSQISLGFGLLHLPLRCPILAKFLLSQFSQKPPPSTCDLPQCHEVPSSFSIFQVMTHHLACSQRSCQAGSARNPPNP